MDKIERANPSLKGALPKNYARPELNKQGLGEPIDMVGTLNLIAQEEGVNGGRDVWAVAKICAVARRPSP